MIYDDRAGPCHETCEVMANRLRSTTVKDVFAFGLHEYLTELIEQTAALGGEIQDFYMR